MAETLAYPLVVLSQNDKVRNGAKFTKISPKREVKSAKHKGFPVCDDDRVFIFSNRLRIFDSFTLELLFEKDYLKGRFTSSREIPRNHISAFPKHPTRRSYTDHIVPGSVKLFAIITWHPDRVMIIDVAEQEEKEGIYILESTPDPQALLFLPGATPQLLILHGESRKLTLVNFKNLKSPKYAEFPSEVPNITSLDWTPFDGVLGVGDKVYSIDVSLKVISESKDYKGFVPDTTLLKLTGKRRKVTKYGARFIGDTRKSRKAVTIVDKEDEVQIFDVSTGTTKKLEFSGAFQDAYIMQNPLRLMSDQLLIFSFSNLDAEPRAPWVIPSADYGADIRYLYSSDDLEFPLVVFNSRAPKPEKARGTESEQGEAQEDEYLRNAIQRVKDDYLDLVEEFDESEEIIDLIPVWRSKKWRQHIHSFLRTVLDPVIPSAVSGVISNFV